MAGRNHNRGHKPLSQGLVQNILYQNPQQANAEQQIATPVIQGGTPLTFDNHTEYDSVHPEDQIRAFIAFARSVHMRYEENARRLEEYHQQEQDLLHYAELADNLNARDGYTYYNKLREMRRVRRECKNENELLKPVVEFLSSPASKDFLNQLSQMQGRCRNAKTTISQRMYTMRTDVI